MSYFLNSNPQKNYYLKNTFVIRLVFKRSTAILQPYYFFVKNLSLQESYTIIKFMETHIYKYNKNVDTYFYYGFGGITIFIGLLFLLAPLLFPLALVLFGLFLLITGFACLIQGFLFRDRHYS